MTKLKFKQKVSEQPTSDFWYDCTKGGYIKPENFLEPEDAKRVTEAIQLLRQFENEAEELELIYSL
jgi:hypothetical protein